MPSEYSTTDRFMHFYVTLFLMQIDKLCSKNTSLTRFNYKSFQRILVQFGEIFRLCHSRHVIQGELEADFF